MVVNLLQREMLEFGTKEYHLDASQIWDKTHEKGSKAKEGLTSGPTPLAGRPVLDARPVTLPILAQLWPGGVSRPCHQGNT